MKFNIVQRGPRAIRMHVDTCKECPFIFDVRSIRPPNMDGFVCGLHNDRPYTNRTRETAPEWCPIRGVAVMIGGPSASSE